VRAGAHGYAGGVRWVNESDTHAYISGIRADMSVRTPEDAERTRTNAMEEYAFLALRTAEGIDEEDFRRTFGTAMDEVYADVIVKYTAQGLLRRSENHVALTEAGMKLGNEVFAAFLLEE